MGTLAVGVVDGPGQGKDQTHQTLQPRRRQDNRGYKECVFALLSKCFDLFVAILDTLRGLLC
eukprot:10286859-Lingulodinium_polyedra.AAC.1